MKHNPYKSLCKLWSGMLVALLLVFSSAGNAVDLTVYTAIEADDLKNYADTFNKDHPDINIKWVRDSTGIVTAKLLAEKDNPQADIIWGLAATSLLLMKSEGMLVPYKPKGLKNLDSNSTTMTRFPVGWGWMLGLRPFVSTPSKRRSII